MTLETILKETEPNKFIRDLIDFVTYPNLGGMTPSVLEAAPPLIKAIIYLNVFDLEIGSSGIWKWFEQEYDEYPDFEKFLDKIGATNASAYIHAATALFPKGRVPKDSDERSDFTDANDRKFREVDWTFEGAGEEAILKLREYLLANRQTLETQTRAYWEIRKANPPKKWGKKQEKQLSDLVTLVESLEITDIADLAKDVPDLRRKPQKKAVAAKQPQTTKRRKH